MTLYIANDYGGTVAAYVAWEREIEQHRAKVIFSGPCVSACTVLLKLPEAQACAVPGALFQFHGGTTRQATDAMWASYPQRIKDWLEARGGLTRNWLYLAGLRVFTMIRRCGNED